MDLSGDSNFRLYFYDIKKLFALDFIIYVYIILEDISGNINIISL